MAKFHRLGLGAVLCALVSVSCGGGSDERGPFAGVPTAPRTVTSLSDSLSNDEAPPTRQLELDQINTLTTRTFTVSGVVTDKAYPAWKISSATVTITPGTLTTRTGSTGQYTARLRAGIYTIKIAKPGYSTKTIKKTVTGTTTVNAALTPIKPSGATARCKDRTWSKSQNRSGTCSSHKGVAYWVCPGKLCH